MPADLEIEWENLTSVQLALIEHSDGKVLRQTLASSLFRALQPAESEIRSGLLSIRHGGMKRTEGEPLRNAIHRGIRVEQIFPKSAAGAKVSIAATPNTRKFRHAARNINARKGWRHPVFGRPVTVHQVGKPGFFDQPLETRTSEFRKVVEEAMDDFARLLRAETRKRRREGGGE